MTWATTWPGRSEDTRPDQLDGEPAWRVSAHDIEKLVCDRIAGLLADQQSMLELEAANDAQSAQRVLAEADLVASRLRSGSAHNKASLLEALRPAILLQHDAVQIRLDRAAIAGTLGVQLSEGDVIELICPATRVRRGHQLRLVVPGPDDPLAAPINRDMKLVKLLAEANEAKRLVLASPGDSVATIAARVGRCRARMAKLIPIACLDPGIVKAIIEGRQSPSLTARSLLDMALPLAWSDQRRVLGFS